MADLSSRKGSFRSSADLLQLFATAKPWSKILVYKHRKKLNQSFQVYHYSCFINEHQEKCIMQYFLKGSIVFFFLLLLFALWERKTESSKLLETNSFILKDDLLALQIYKEISKKSRRKRVVLLSYRIYLFYHIQDWHQANFSYFSWDTEIQGLEQIQEYQTPLFCSLIQLITSFVCFVQLSHKLV